MENGKRIVIYGLGMLYANNKEQIESTPGIVAHCDQSEEKAKAFADGMTVEELSLRGEEYDIVYVTAAPMKVVPYLVDELHIPFEKIVPFGYGQLDIGGGHPITQFRGQYNDDAVLACLLQLCGKKLNEITYLEIGTNDPVKMNNSYFFYEQGAHGVLVDPLPEIQRMVELYRPRDRFVRAAVTGTPETDTITFHEANALMLSSIHENNLDGFKSKGARFFRKSYTVPLKGINDLLENMERTPELLLIDAEGEDMAIVEALDYEKYRPLAILVELGDEAAFVRYFATRGYRWFTSISHGNAVFIDGEAMRR